MVGLLLFGLLVGYVAFWAYLIKVARNRLERVAAVSLAVLIPFWELPISFVNYQFQCREYGGLRIFGDPPRAESILFDTDIGYRAEFLTREYGFKKIEIATRSQGVMTFTMTKDGIERSSQPRATSSFKIAYRWRQPAGFNVTRNELVLSRVDGDQVLARHTAFLWQGMWWQNAISNTGQEILGQCHSNDRGQLLRFASKGTK